MKKNWIVVSATHKLSCRCLDCLRLFGHISPIGILSSPFSASEIETWNKHGMAPIDTIAMGEVEETFELDWA